MPPSFRALGLWCADARRKPNAEAGGWIHPGCGGFFDRQKGVISPEKNVVSCGHVVISPEKIVDFLFLFF